MAFDVGGNDGDSGDGDVTDGIDLHGVSSGDVCVDLDIAGGDGGCNQDSGAGSDDALPIGAHLVLDPTLDIDALNLPPAERTIAKALQKYGMFLADSSGGFTLYAVHPSSFAGNPYIAIWGDVTYAGINGIPFDRIKVLPLGEQKPRHDGPPMSNRCTQPHSGTSPHSGTP